jgi:hypothetical protein
MLFGSSSSAGLKLSERFWNDRPKVTDEVIHELKRTKKRGLILKIDFEKAYDKVKWDFLEEVMRGKGFSDKWIGWVMQTLRGGRVCINVNGRRSPYFRTYQGLRQGDPLLPMLFNTVPKSAIG